MSPTAWAARLPATRCGSPRRWPRSRTPCIRCLTRSAERNPATAHLFIINPLTGGGMDNLFSTHPATAEPHRGARGAGGRNGRGALCGAGTRGGFFSGAGAGPWGGSSVLAAAAGTRRGRAVPGVEPARRVLVVAGCRGFAGAAIAGAVIARCPDSAVAALDESLRPGARERVEDEQPR